MKNNFITKIIGATLAFAMMIGGAVGINAAKEAKEVNADDLTSTLTFNAKANGSGTADNGAVWTITSDGSESNFDSTKGIHFGTSSAQVGYIQLSTDDIDGAITSVVVNASTGSGVTASVSVTVGGNAYGGDAQSLSQTATNYTFTGSASGAIAVRIAKPSKATKAIYCKSIAVSYTTGGTVATKYTVRYDGNGATNGTVPTDNNEYDANDPVTVLGNTGNLEKENYTFGGWTDGEDTYGAGEEFNITASITLHAVWNTQNGFDYLNRDFTGIANGAQYGSWSGKTGTSGTVYAGYSGGTNDSIQLRTEGSNSGVISTTSGGNIKKVTVIWESNTTNGRTLNIYAKNTAYSSAEDLYNANTQGTLVGTIVKGTSTSFTFNTDYRYVGVRSNSGAMYLTELHFKWEEVQLEPRVTLDKTSVNLKTTQTNGTTVTAFVEDVETPEYLWESDNSNVTLENNDTATVTIKPNTNVAASSTITLTVGGTNPNLTATVTVTIAVPGPGESAEKAFTVAQARAHIDSIVSGGDNTGNDGNEYYATGIVSEIVTPFSSQYKNISYNISADGSTSSEQLQAYRGKGIDGADFTSEDDIEVGDTVVVYGYLQIHGETYEFAQDNQLVSRVLAPQVNSITLTPSTVTVEPEDAGDIVDLFTNIVINQDQGSTKTVNDIEWSSDDDSVLYIDGGEYLVAGAHRTSTTIRALIGGKEYGHATINVFKANTHVMNYDLPEEWRIVDDISTLAAGDQVILTAVDGGNIYAAGTYASGNNVPADEENALTESNGTVTGVQNTMIYTLETGTKPGSLAFRDSAGKYLYAASSSSNWMKAQDDIDDNASFILNDNGTVVAQGTYSRKYMRYNPNGNNNGLFACYASNSDTGTLVTFYKLSAGTAELDLFNLNAISEAHEDGNGAYIRLGVSLSEEDWATMNSAFGIAGYGVMLIRETTLETTGFDSIEELYNSDSENKSKLSNLGKDSETAPQDFSVAAKINIKNESDRNVAFCAAVYVKSSSGAIYFINETCGSLVGLL